MSLIQVTHTGDELDRNQLVDAVDEELQAFNEWFVSTFEGAEPLAKYERAIIKTYLMKKLEEPPQA